MVVPKIIKFSGDLMKF